MRNRTLLGLLLIAVAAGGLAFHHFPEVKGGAQYVYYSAVGPPKCGLSAKGKIHPMVEENMEEIHEVPIIIELTAPEGKLARAQTSRVVPQVKRIGAKVTHRFTDSFNGISCFATKEEILKIARLGDVKRVWPDFKLKTTIADSVPHIGAPEVWEEDFKGEGVYVNMFDSGVDKDHKWLDHVPEILSWGPQDHGMFHGTWTSGIVFADAGDGEHIGVAPRIEGVLDIDSFPRGSSSVRRILNYQDRLLRWYKDHPDVRPLVSSNSWGGPPGYAGTWEEPNPLEQSANKLSKKGIVQIFAAGNSGRAGLETPGCAKFTICVGAINDANDEIAGFSSRGPTKNGHRQPDLVAPGVNILSSVPGDALSGAYSGTSASCPHVTGTVALMLSKNPNLSFKQVRSILDNTAKDLGPDGWDKDYGWGLVQAYEAWKATPSPPVAPTGLLMDIGLALVGAVGFVAVIWPRRFKR